MKRQELVDKGITGHKLQIASALRQKSYIFASISLIGLYALVLLVYLAFGELITSGVNEHQLYFQLVELIFLVLLFSDFLVHIYTFGQLYLDYWNIFDISLISVNLAIVILDISSNNGKLSQLSKARSVFKILRIILIMRQINSLLKIRELDGILSQKANLISCEDETYEFKSPMEKVLSIIGNLISRIDQSSEGKIIEDLKFCLKVLSSNNNLYDAELIIKGGDGSKFIHMKNEEILEALSNSQHNAQSNNEQYEHSGSQHYRYSKRYDVLRMMNQFGKSINSSSSAALNNKNSSSVKVLGTNTSKSPKKSRIQSMQVSGNSSLAKFSSAIAQKLPIQRRKSSLSVENGMVNFGL